jgi:hypothetical protein
MTAPPISPAQTLSQRFESAFKDPARVHTFDMVDEPDLPHLEGFDRFQDAIRFLDRELRPKYDAADESAMRHQARHRLVAKLAITSGGLAIGFAIIQLALLQSVPGWAGVVAGMEAFAVLAGGLAVALGLWARSDRQWLVQRHIAERLRMLKFRAFGRKELWVGNIDDWKAWALHERNTIVSSSTFAKVMDWVDDDRAMVEPDVKVSAGASQDAHAIATYYRWKRIKFQAAYFDRQGRKLMSPSTRLLPHAGLPLFALTVLAVVVHFAIDLWVHGAGTLSPQPVVEKWKLVGTWALAAAALLPVLSLCLRAWTGAFEYLRSGQLFKAKQRVLENAATDIAASTNAVPVTLRQIATIEYTLEQEHREWLRLMRTAEWFL